MILADLKKLVAAELGSLPVVFHDYLFHQDHEIGPMRLVSGLREIETIEFWEDANGCRCVILSDNPKGTGHE
jgi:hypothetical protein